MHSSHTLRDVVLLLKAHETLVLRMWPAISGFTSHCYALSWKHLPKEWKYPLCMLTLHYISHLWAYKPGLSRITTFPWHEALSIPESSISDIDWHFPLQVEDGKAYCPWLFLLGIMGHEDFSRWFQPDRNPNPVNGLQREREKFACRNRRMWCHSITWWQSRLP